MMGKGNVKVVAGEMSKCSEVGGVVGVKVVGGGDYTTPKS